MTMSSAAKQVSNKKHTEDFELPADWTSEKRLRSNGRSYDMYYREPSTGKQFDSLAAVEEYLSEAKDGAAQLKPVKSRSEGKNVVGEHDEASVLDLPTDEVKYVIRNPESTEWDVYVNGSETPLSEPARKAWFERVEALFKQ